jgi:hypothetical protein
MGHRIYFITAIDLARRSEQKVERKRPKDVGRVRRI